MIGGGQLLQHANLLMKLEGKSFWMVWRGKFKKGKKRKAEERCAREVG
jgi:hypothetical protein